MGQLVIVCAGASVDIQPAPSIESILFNVPNNAGRESDIRRTKELIRHSGAKYVFLDSGGFQLFVAQEKGQTITFDRSKPIKQPHGINLSPYHVVQAAKEINPTIMMGLDFPIQTLKDKGEQEIEFMKKFSYNVRWALETSDLRQQYCPLVQLFMPVQCYTLEHFKLFHRLIKDTAYDGLSMPCRNLDLEEINSFLCLFESFGIKQVHLLGVSAFFPIALSAYMARHYFDWISLDATTWRIQAEKSEFMNHRDLTPENVNYRVVIPPSVINDCPCPYCNGTSFYEIREMPYYQKLRHLHCHNYWVIENAAKKLFEHAGDLYTFRAYLRTVSPNRNKIEMLIKLLSRLKYLGINAA